MYPKQIKYYLPIFLTIIFLLISTALLWSTSTNPDDKVMKTSENSDRRFDELEKLIENLKTDRYQAIMVAYENNSKKINQLLSFIGWITTGFGLMLALGAIIISYISIQSRQRSEKAISTIENAKKYIEEELDDFKKTLHHRIAEIDDLKKIVSDQIMNEIEQSEKRISEKRDRSISALAEEKVVKLEKKVQLIEALTVADDAKRLYSQAILCQRKGLLHDAIDLLTKAIKVKPSYFDALIRMASIYSELGDFEKAIESLTAVIKKDPTNSIAHHNRALYYKITGNNDQALDGFNEACRIEPDNVFYIKNRIIVLEAMGKLQESLKQLDILHTLDPFGPDYYSLRGWLLLRQGKNKEAINAYKIAAQKRKEIIAKNDMNEGTWLEYYENLIILNEFKELENIDSVMLNILKTDRLIVVYDFLKICSNIVQGKIEMLLDLGNNLINNFMQHIPKAIPKWNFDDILLSLKLKLKDDEYALIDKISDFLQNRASGEECKTILKEFVDHRI